MLYVKKKNRSDDLIELESGATFIQLDSELYFDIGWINEDFEPITVFLKISDNPEKDNHKIESTDLVDRKLGIIYYNPTVGTSGMKEPIIILENKKYEVQLIFHINRINNSSTVKISYSFYMKEKEVSNG